MSRRMLAIESATDWLSIALLDDAECVVLREAEGTRRHASELMPLVEAGLAEAGWSLGGLDALAISTGPGSFTSLRIGLATAKGLAFGRDWEAAGVSTLEAMALAAFERGEGAHEVLALLDARRGEWYAGGWCRTDADRRPTLAEGLYEPAALVADAAGGVTVVCPEPPSWRPVFEAAGLEIVAALDPSEARPRADRVGRLGRVALERGEGVAVEVLTARYLRRAEAEAKRLGASVEAGEVARLGEPSRARPFAGE